MTDIKISVHPVSHRLEWRGWDNFSPALRATDYKCPHCIMIEYDNLHTPRYKRGTIIKDGKLYGRYPDGSLYRIYSTSDRPFLQIVDRKGETFLRIRQATEQGYTDCPCPGAADLSYPSSALRRSRTVGGVSW